MKRSLTILAFYVLLALVVGGITHAVLYASDVPRAQWEPAFATYRAESNRTGWTR